ncbi:acyl-CoA thioesterase [Serinicoccus marinus]|uniref:acyl-CoA thioesterase n=1 Tax=Serinicoccus marinus TaxID=247333 RepID=UPI00249024EC|nr:acyl-CoA thioesterase [Serinicoccus marinus]
MTPAGKAPEESRLTLSQIMGATDTNLLGTVHGGVLMRLADSLAGVVTARHSGGPTVTVAIDEMVFVTPVQVGDVLHLHSQVNWAGTSSMEAGVRLMADRWDRTDPPIHVASAYLVFVAVDEEGSSRQVPPLLPQTEEERRRFREAEIRRSHRLARRDAIVNSRAIDPEPAQG